MFWADAHPGHDDVAKHSVGVFDGEGEPGNWVTLING
jgi:hypothetical protein